MGRSLSLSAALAAGALLAACGGLDGGPLAPRSAEALIGGGVLLDPGETFVDRTVVLYNRTDETAEVISIRRLGSTGRAQDLREYVALGIKSTDAVTGAGEHFPPRGYRREDLKPPAGFKVPSKNTREGRLGAVIMTTGRLAGGDMYGQRGYQVRYRIGDDEYQTEFHSVIAVCAAKGEKCNPDPLTDRLMDEAREARDG